MFTETVSQILIEVAQRVILPRFGALSDDDIQEKHPGDLVTIADKEAEAEIAEALAGYTPDTLVVGEEGVFSDQRILAALPQAEHAWVIDPIDGTRNFARARADFGVMVAEVRKNEVVRGWIYQPIHKRIYVAERGAGVYCNDQPVFPPHSDREHPLGATYVPLLKEETSRLKIRRTWGSCAVDYPNLLTGEVDFLAYRSMFPWDHLAGGLMVEELGGKIATQEGNRYRAGTTGRRVISAMNPQIWQQACDAMAMR